MEQQGREEMITSLKGLCGCRKPRNEVKDKCEMRTILACSFLTLPYSSKPSTFVRGEAPGLSGQKVSFPDKTPWLLQTGISDRRW